MWIRGSTIIVDKCSELHVLKDSTLVIDAQNFMYNLYSKGEFNKEYGTECDLYADYIKKYLNMFKEANIKCYFIFKGGTKNLERRIINDQIKCQVEHKGRDVNPILMNDIHLQVLKEMNFDYVFSEYEAKNDCIALARKLSCPVLSMDVEYSFSGVQYVPVMTLQYDENGKQINCKIVSLNDLLQKYSLDKDKLAIFILLSDEKIFIDNVFDNFFKQLRMPQENSFKRHIALLRWLSRTPVDRILKVVLDKDLGSKCLSKERILEELENVKKLVDRDFDGPLPTDYNILNKDDFTERWFEKGVALNIIAKQYIDIYRSNILLVTLSPEDKHNSIKLSLKIIKYAYDLLTNFHKNGFLFITHYWDNNSEKLRSERMPVNESIKKPIYQAKSSVFENGWDDISTLGLFQHFLVEEINFNFDALLKVPDEAKLLFVALAYYSNKKPNSIKLSYSILLSYVVLGFVKNDDKSHKRASMNSSDCKLAMKILGRYFQNDEMAAKANLRHSVLEFQHCLKHLNYLNKLCGLPYKETNYSKTYNGTFVYNILKRMQNEDESLFFEKMLGPAPTVLTFISQNIDMYQKMIPIN